jgi:Ser/Thr protein kinase RdoA (MazF antagonist)
VYDTVCPGLFTHDRQMTQASFPVIYSTLSCGALVTHLLSKYDIGEVLSCQFWRRGLSDIYLVETQVAQYVLRVSHAHWRSLAEVAFELELLEFLYQKRIPVAYPLRTMDGELWIPLQAPEGDRYASLFIYAPGCVPIGDLNPTQSYTLGRTVAQFHQVGQTFKSSFSRSALTLDFLVNESIEIIKPFMVTRKHDLTNLVKSAEDLVQSLSGLPKDDPHWTTCWGDPHSGNVHFTSDDRLTLFDFDQCGYGWRAFEVAKFFQVALRGGVSLQVRGAFLAGYQSVSPLEPWELESLRAFTQVSHIWSWSISLTHAQLHDYCKLDYHFFNRRLEHLMRLRSPDCHLY